jgi:branched-chain amino acid transport system permease protein
LLILASVVLAGIGSAVILLPDRWRVALLNGFIWVLGIGIFSENVTQILNQFGGKVIIRFLFQSRSLNPLPAILIFVGAFVVAYFRVHVSVQNRWAKMPPSQQKKGRSIGIVVGILLLIALPWMVGQFLSQALFNVGLFIMMGLGLNIVVGYAGLLDLGYVAFFCHRCLHHGHFHIYRRTWNQWFEFLGNLANRGTDRLVYGCNFGLPGFALARRLSGYRNPGFW